MILEGRIYTELEIDFYDVHFSHCGMALPKSVVIARMEPLW